MKRVRKQYKDSPSDAQIAEFQLLEPLLLSAISEMREFSKKKQDGVVNEMKIKLLNRLLEDIRTNLQGEPSVRYLEALEPDQLPQNSDVVLILGQYQAAMKNFRQRFFRGYPLDRWLTQEYWMEKEELARQSEEDEEYEDEEEDES